MVIQINSHHKKSQKSVVLIAIEIVRLMYPQIRKDGHDFLLIIYTLIHSHDSRHHLHHLITYDRDSQVTDNKSKLPD